MSVGVMKRWWDKRVLTCRSCLAASAPARVWNVTKPTGCKGKEQKHILSLRRSCGWKVSNYFMPIMVAVGLLLTRAAGCFCSHKPSSSSASIRTLQWRCSSTGKVHLKVGKVEAHTTTSGTVEGPLLCDIENTYRCGFAIFAGHLQQRSLVTLFELRRIIGKLNQITGYWYGKFDVCQFLTSNRLITIRLGITPSTLAIRFGAPSHRRYQLSHARLPAALFSYLISSEQQIQLPRLRIHRQTADEEGSHLRKGRADN